MKLYVLSPFSSVHRASLSRAESRRVDPFPARLFLLNFMKRRVYLDSWLVFWLARCFSLVFHLDRENTLSVSLFSDVTNTKYSLSLVLLRFRVVLEIIVFGFYCVQGALEFDARWKSEAGGFISQCNTL